MEDTIEKDVKQIKKQYNQVYYQKHKERIVERITCGCGLVYSKSNKSIHCDGRVHKLWVKMIKEAESKTI